MQNLYILGLPATIFDDESIACSLHEERHLLPWMGDEGTRVDRYDARLLLEDLSAFECSTSSSNYQEEVDPDLEHERYADLDYSKEWQLTRLIQDGGHGALGQFCAMGPCHLLGLSYWHNFTMQPLFAWF